MGQDPALVGDRAPVHPHGLVLRRRVPEGRSALSVPTVVWWELTPRDRIGSWLLITAGSPPLADQAWVTQFAAAAAEEDGWAVACSVPLMPVDPALTTRLATAAGGAREGLHSLIFPSDGGTGSEAADPALYDACRQEALRLVVEHLRSERVTREPRTSGVLALRRRPQDGELILDIGPAVAEPSWLGREIGLDLGALAAAEREVTFGSEIVSLGDGEVTLPCARVSFGEIDRARVALQVVLPSVWLPGAPEPLIDPFPVA